MRRGLELVSGLENELNAAKPMGNRDGLRHVQAQSALQTLRCIFEAGLLRTESRGAFFREDFPEQDDAQWLRNIRISLNRTSGQLLLSEKSLESPHP
jgi:succinate dehydrogenase/fumarate reductase flavoprotein subunit